MVAVRYCSRSLLHLPSGLAEHLSARDLVVPHRAHLRCPGAWLRSLRRRPFRRRHHPGQQPWPQVPRLRPAAAGRLCAGPGRADAADHGRRRHAHRPCGRSLALRPAADCGHQCRHPAVLGHSPRPQRNQRSGPGADDLRHRQRRLFTGHVQLAAAHVDRHPFRPDGHFLCSHRRLAADSRADPPRRRPSACHHCGDLPHLCVRRPLPAGFSRLSWALRGPLLQPGLYRRRYPWSDHGGVLDLYHPIHHLRRLPAGL